MRKSVIVRYTPTFTGLIFIVSALILTACGDVHYPEYATGNTGNNWEYDEDEDESGLQTCPVINPFCHYKSGQWWSDIAEEEMTWDEAKLYCSKLGGKLPTISELRTLVIICKEIQSNGACTVTDECLASSCWVNECDCETDFDDCSFFNDEKELWSISKVEDDPGRVWFLDFDLGYISDYSEDYTVYVRCVN